MNLQKRRLSLKWSMITLVLCCWVLPLVLLFCISGYYINRNLYDKVSQVIGSTVYNMAGISQLQLEQVVEQSLSATYTGEIKRAWQEYVSQPDGGTVAGNSVLYQDVTTYLRNQYRNHALVRYSNVQFLTQDFLEDLNTSSIYYYDSGRTDRGKFEDHKFYRDKVQPQVLELSNTLGGRIAFLNEEGRIYVTRCIYSNNKPVAMLTLELEPEILQLGELPKQGWNKGAVITVDGCAVTTGEAIQPPELNFEAVAGKGVQIAPVRGQANYAWVYGSQQAERFTMDYVILADMTAMITQSDSFLGALAAIVLLLVPLMASVIIFFYRKINRPVQLLTSASGRIERGEFGVQVDESKMGSAELEYLGGQFNRMSGQLQNQFERIYREELALRDARIMALQSQINPHFLGNTLEVINWEARLAGDVKVSVMLEALSTILEATMDRRHRSTIHLSEELHYVNAYLTIIGQRLGRRLTVERQIDESLLQEEVPRLVMQPILENAVEHGVGDKLHGTIVIRACRENQEWMLLEVENDAPLAPEDEAHIRQLLTSEEQPAGAGSTSLGIRNVHQRLRILYGEESGLSVKTTKNGHTLSSMRVRLTQP